MAEKTPEERGRREPLPVPEEVVAWEEDVQAMTEEEFFQYLDEQEGGLAFGA
jgi:hypothetical protein